MDGFTTASGSAYEVDIRGQRIRRVGNAAGRPPTPRQGDDGHWRTFYTLVLTHVPTEPQPSILIIWDEAGAATITSMINTLSPGITHLSQQSEPDQDDPDT